MIGFYFSQHFDEGVHMGLRVESPGDPAPYKMNTYNEIYLGRDFFITKNFNLRINLSFSYMSEIFLGFNGEFKYKKLGFLAGINYLF